MDKQKVIELLTNNSWKFAKTMPQHPHWYTLRRQWRSGKEFEEVVQFIRDHGVKKQWGGATYIYLIHDGFEYWTMGAALRETILINKAKV